MKMICRPVFPAALILALATTLAANARPIEFSEISLLVRAHEGNPVILGEVRTRKLPHPLTAPQENTLKAQGADDDLIRDLRGGDFVLSPEAAATLADEEQRASKTHVRATEADDSLGEQVHVFDVSYDQPVDLSQWGGPSREIAFHLRRYAGEDVVEPIVVDSHTSAATYLGQGRPDDQTTIFDRRDYVSVISYDHSRPSTIDTINPISMKGVPYLLYPVSGVGGVSLYYIGKSGGSVRLAVIPRI